MSKCLYLLYQRMEHKLATEENSYDNLELLQALIQAYCVFFNYISYTLAIGMVQNIQKNYIMMNMEIIVAILSIWGNFSNSNESVVHEICMRFESSIRNRS